MPVPEWAVAVMAVSVSVAAIATCYAVVVTVRRRLTALRRGVLAAAFYSREMEELDESQSEFVSAVESQRQATKDIDAVFCDDALRVNGGFPVADGDTDAACDDVTPLDEDIEESPYYVASEES